MTKWHGWFSLWCWGVCSVCVPGWVVGSLEILGSPASLVLSIGNGVSDFFRLPYEGLTRGPGAFVSGVSRGTTSFVKHISKGNANLPSSSSLFYLWIKMLVCFFFFVMLQFLLNFSQNFESWHIYSLKLYTLCLLKFICGSALVLGRWEDSLWTSRFISLLICSHLSSQLFFFPPPLSACSERSLNHCKCRMFKTYFPPVLRHLDIHH